MIHSCPLKCELQVHGLIFSSHLKVVLLTSCQCIFFSFLFCFSSQASRFYKKKLLYSPLEEQAMTLNSLFIKRDRRKKIKKHQRNWNRLQSNVTSLSFPMWVRASVPCFLCAWLSEGFLFSLSPWVKLSLEQGSSLFHRWDRCLFGMPAACHTQPFSCLGLCTALACGG